MAGRRYSTETATRCLRTMVVGWTRADCGAKFLIGRSAWKFDRAKHVAMNCEWKARDSRGVTAGESLRSDTGRNKKKNEKSPEKSVPTIYYFASFIHGLERPANGKTIKRFARHVERISRNNNGVSLAMLFRTCFSGTRTGPGLNLKAGHTGNIFFGWPRLNAVGRGWMRLPLNNIIK